MAVPFKEIMMNILFKKCLELISCCLLGLSLASCNTTQSTSTEQHPEGKYGEFGGNGEHDHASHPKTDG